MPWPAEEIKIVWTRHSDTALFMVVSEPDYEPGEGAVVQGRIDITSGDYPGEAVWTWAVFEGNDLCREARIGWGSCLTVVEAIFAANAVARVPIWKRQAFWERLSDVVDADAAAASAELDFLALPDAR